MPAAKGGPLLTPGQLMMRKAQEAALKQDDDTSSGGTTPKAADVVELKPHEEVGAAGDAGNVPGAPEPAPPTLAVSAAVDVAAAAPAPEPETTSGKAAAAYLPAADAPPVSVVQLSDIPLAILEPERQEENEEDERAAREQQAYHHKNEAPGEEKAATKFGEYYDPAPSLGYSLGLTRQDSLQTLETDFPQTGKTYGTTGRTYTAVELYGELQHEPPPAPPLQDPPVQADALQADPVQPSAAPPPLRETEVAPVEQSGGAATTAADAADVAAVAVVDTGKSHAAASRVQKFFRAGKKAHAEKIGFGGGFKSLVSLKAAAEREARERAAKRAANSAKHVPRVDPPPTVTAKPKPKSQWVNQKHDQKGSPSPPPQPPRTPIVQAPSPAVETTTTLSRGIADESRPWFLSCLPWTDENADDEGGAAALHEGGGGSGAPPHSPQRVGSRVGPPSAAAATVTPLFAPGAAELMMELQVLASSVQALADMQDLIMDRLDTLHTRVTSLDTAVSSLHRAKAQAKLQGEESPPHSGASALARSADRFMGLFSKPSTKRSARGTGGVAPVTATTDGADDIIRVDQGLGGGASAVKGAPAQEMADAATAGMGAAPQVVKAMGASCDA